MRVVILAAGQSKRFFEEGYTTPKPFLAIDYRSRIRTMLEHVICTIPFQFNITIALSSGWAEQARKMPISRNIACMDVGETKGPGQSALVTLRELRPESILIMDVDVLNMTNDLFGLTLLSNPGVLVSWSANPSFSYVDKLGSFSKIEEKVRISEYAVRGAYFVPDSAYRTFITALEETVMDTSEPFISHVFNRITTTKTSMLTSYIPVEWGTPRDVKLSGAHIIEGG